MYLPVRFRTQDLGQLPKQIFCFLYLLSIDEVGHDFDGEETLNSLYWVRLPDVLLEISDLWCHRKRFSTSSCRTVWLHNIVYDPPTERSSFVISKLYERFVYCQNIRIVRLNFYIFSNSRVAAVCEKVYISSEVKTQLKASGYRQEAL